MALTLPVLSATVRQSIVRIVREAFPWLAYTYPRSFSVRASYPDGSCDLDPAPTESDLKALDRVPQWIVGSVIVQPAAGTPVLVAFADANETRPRIVAIGPQPPGKAVARKDDGAGRWAFDPTAKILYYSNGASPTAYVAVATTAGPPPGTFAGTPAVITSGSPDVTSA